MRPYSARTAAWLKALCVAAWLLGATRTQAQTTLPQTIAALVAASPVHDRIGLSVIDLATGKSLVAFDERSARNPASNMKLITAAAAMQELGPAFRMRTAMSGRIEASSVTGGLCLKGGGDPTLNTADLLAFAKRLADEGVRQVDEVVIDGTYFDAQVLPPAFEQQPGEVAPFRAAIAALSINENAYTLRVRPGAAEGTPAAVSVDGSGYFEIDNKLTTSAGGAPNVIADQRASGEKLALALRGSIPLASASMAFARRVESPLHYAGHAFVDALRSLRIQVPKRVIVGACPASTPLISMRNSPPLSEILAALGKDSDNFVAEMVLKVLGAERKRTPGRSADGAAVAIDTLKRIGVPIEGLKMVNGSGLFQGNEVSSQQLAALLLAMYRNPSLRDDFVAHLAVGGVDGTLSRRFRSLPQPRIVRAKTGTLDSVISLSGYVLGPKPGEGFAFAYLANAISGKQGDARSLVDAVVEALAASLYPPKHP
jgi:serine-type D-Ala-D-Ala carboxypeptidase/endopeptidase (penicillin-binding protein 4)